MSQTEYLIKIFSFETHLKQRNLVQLITSYAVANEDCSLHVSRDKWQKEIQLE